MHSVESFLTFTETDFYYSVTLRELHAFLNTHQKLTLYSFLINKMYAIPEHSIATVDDFTQAKEAQVATTFKENVSDEEFSLLELMWSAIYFNIFDLGLNQEEATKRILAYLYWHDPRFKIFYLHSVA